jgi:two-component system response regulator NreC
VHSGQNYFSADVTLALINPSGNGHSVQINELLTDRETEILQLIAGGFSNKEIGDQLFISHRTVDTHRTNLMKKLGVNNIAGLISYAIKNGIV